jgi:choline-glycine betaine transporter
MSARFVYSVPVKKNVLKKSEPNPIVISATSHVTHCTDLPLLYHFLFNALIYVFLLLCLCILIVCLCIFFVPAGTLRLP